jgi:hypothetical protein
MIDTETTAALPLPSPGAPMVWATETSSRHENSNYTLVIHVPGWSRAWFMDQIAAGKTGNSLNACHRVD